MRSDLGQNRQYARNSKRLHEQARNGLKNADVVNGTDYGKPRSCREYYNKLVGFDPCCRHKKE